ncbi:hypothetical protein BH10PSE17_BH10PSE17_19970 [soil metagenome]
MNEPYITSTLATTTPDATLGFVARGLLANNIELPRECVDVIVQQGHLTLVGHVQWPFQRASAETSVQTLGGLVGITNRITVEPRRSGADVAESSAARTSRLPLRRDAGNR